MIYIGGGPGGGNLKMRFYRQEWDIFNFACASGVVRTFNDM
jgi:hypothetical protein